MNNTFIHEFTFAIAWGDMDALGHVNNARYFDYFQEARIDWLHQLGMNLTSESGPVVVEAACTFLKPVVYPAILTLKSRLENPGRTSIIMRHFLFQNETLMAEGHCKLVWVNYTSARPVELPDALKNP